jgi:hypothetical protein
MVQINSFKFTPEGNFGKRALLIGIIGLLLGLFGFFIDRGHFFHSYLIAFVFWLSLALGGLFFTMLHHLVGATWSVVLRRLSENIMSTFLFLAVFIVPIILGIGDLYHWSHTDLIAGDELLMGKTPYLNVPFFIIRTIIYFAIWIFLARALYKGSLAQDQNFEEGRLARMKRISAPGMVLFALTVTFASFDWLMSLNASWYSTAFGVYIFAGSVLAVLALITLIAIYLRGRGFLVDVITVEHYHDLGKLLFTFVVFWGYIAFAQYFLIWYGNIPEETQWFHSRWGGWWEFITLLIVFGHFVVPFVVLITREAKRSLPVLTVIGIWILFLHWVDIYWVVMPAHPEHVISGLWIDISLMVGIGGMFLWFLWKRMTAAALVPVNEPNLEASIQLQSD